MNIVRRIRIVGSGGFFMGKDGVIAPEGGGEVLTLQCKGIFT